MQGIQHTYAYIHLYTESRGNLIPIIIYTHKRAMGTDGWVGGGGGGGYSKV